jgi:hypothetical protein
MQVNMRHCAACCIPLLCDGEPSPCLVDARVGVLFLPLFRRAISRQRSVELPRGFPKVYCSTPGPGQIRPGVTIGVVLQCTEFSLLESRARRGWIDTCNYAQGVSILQPGRLRDIWRLSRAPPIWATPHLGHRYLHKLRKTRTFQSGKTHSI